MKTLTKVSRAAGGVAACLLAFGVADAKASPKVDTSSLRLQGARSEGGMLLPSAWLLEKGGWDLSLTYDHEGDVLRARVPTDNLRGGARSVETPWIEQRDLALLQLAASPFDRMELSASLPVLLGQTVSSDSSLDPPRSGSTAFGDVRLGVRYALVGSQDAGWGASLQGGLLVPSGGAAHGVGDGKARADVAGSFGFRSEAGWGAQLHVGHLMGQPFALGDQLLGDTAYGGLLLQYRHDVDGRSLLWSLEAVGGSVTSAADPGTDPRRASLEILGGARYLFDTVYVDLGGGFAPVDDGATPRWRALASIGARGLWESAPPPAPQREIVYVTPPPAAPAPTPPEPPPAPEAARPADAMETFRTYAVEERAIFFEVGKAELDDIARSLLRTVALNLLATRKSLLITGYADDQGTRERNEELSRRRAESVRNALLDAGVGEERLKIEGVGDKSPAAPSTAFGRSINRRVTFTWIE